MRMRVDEPGQHHGATEVERDVRRPAAALARGTDRDDLSLDVVHVDPAAGKDGGDDGHYPLCVDTDDHEGT